MKIKRIIAAVALAACLAAPALADIDLSGLSFEELLELQKQVTTALWASDGWQEVTVPTGIYEVGTDIPAGRWNVTARESAITIYPSFSDAVNGKGLPKLYYIEGDTVAIAVEDGFGISITGDATFTPYIPAFTFE